MEEPLKTPKARNRDKPRSQRRQPKTEVVTARVYPVAAPDKPEELRRRLLARLIESVRQSKTGRTKPRGVPPSLP